MRAPGSLFNTSHQRRKTLSSFVLLGSLSSASAFTFTNTSPTQCDPLTVNWTGGQPPFNLLIIPPGKPYINITIPSSAFTNNIGSFSTQLELPQFQRVLFTVSDAKGISSGGITNVLTVGASTSGTQCNTTSKVADFYFSLDNDLEECEPYPFSQFPGAVQPITIYGFVAEGESFVLHPQSPIDSYTFSNNLTAGTSVTFGMLDSQNRSGGTSDIRVVRLSDNKSCVPSTGLIEPGDSISTKKSTNIGVIAGAAVGGAAVVFFLILALFCIRRRKKNNNTNGKVIPIKNGNAIDLLCESPGGVTDGSRTITPFATEQQATVPFLSTKQQMLQAESTRSYPSTPMMSEFSHDSISQLQPGYSSMGYRPSAVQSSSQAGSSSSIYTALRNNGSEQGEYVNSSQRVIMHTDIAETANEEPLELPPSYSAGRAPIPGMNTIIVHSSSTGTVSPPRKS